METRKTFQASAANFQMIDIAKKTDTERRAVASGVFFAARSTITKIRERSLPKGDVLILAEVAGIQGAKMTSQVLPLCHPLSLTSVKVWTEVLEDRVLVFCEAKTVGKTGVEMEALSGVNAALLCIYDLTKGVDPVLTLGEIKLELKEGGKSGVWTSTQEFKNLKASILISSDRCSRGEAEDLAGPAAQLFLEAMGAEVLERVVVPDDEASIRTQIGRMLDGFKSKGQPQLIVTSGGTGISPRDITPEVIEAICHERGGRVVPGVGELLRQNGAQHTPMSWLSRSIGVQIENSLIICLPGSPKAVTQGLGAIANLIQHALDLSSGGTQH